MGVKIYEIAYIISSELNSAEVEQKAKEIESAIQAKEGVILRSEKLTAQTLAYPIKGRSSGYFGILDMQIAQNHVKDIKEMLEKDSKILRNFIIVKKPFKELKERRSRKPEFAGAAAPTQSQSPFKHEEKLEVKEVSAEDLNKKLDEILGE